MKRALITILTFLIAHLAFCQPNWVYSLDQAKALALSNSKLIFIDFTASWCAPCHKMDINVWSHPNIDSLSRKFVMLKIDIDRDRKVAMDYKVQSIPKIMIIDFNENEFEDRLGYSDVVEVSDMMKTYPASTKIINDALLAIQADGETFHTHHQAGMAYSKYLEILDGSAQQNFFRLSKEHLRKAYKLALKADDEIFIQKIILDQGLTYGRMQEHDKAMKTIEKFGQENFSATNQCYMYYIMGYSAKVSGLENKYLEYKTQLDSMKGGAYFSKLLSSF